MASPAILEKKKQLVQEIAGKLKGSCSGVVIDYKGITVADDTNLRKKLREAEVDYFVVKNSLLALAADEAGLDDLKEVLTGATAIALSENNYFDGAKILNEFAESKKDFFSIKSGFFDGKVVSVERIKVLSKMPGKEGLVAKALGSMMAPVSNLVYALNAIADKKKEEEQTA